MATHRQKTQFISGNYSVEGESQLTVEQEVALPPITIANSVTDQEVVFSIDRSQLVSLFLLASVAMTLETNSGSSATDTIALAAGIPYRWFTGQYNTCLITADVTKFFLTNASGGSGTFQAYAGHGDSTP